MATLVFVTNANDNRLFINAFTEQMYPLFTDYVSRVNGETAAETVEMFMLIEQNMVASWHWNMEHGINLLGQFVAARNGGRAFKEISDSRARHFDI